MIAQPVTHFGLIRHATTIWNEQKKIQGQLDSALSPGGKMQAETWGKQLQGLPWQRIIHSDLGRAGQTAVFINKTLKLPMDAEPQFREQDWGEWSGMSLASIKAKHKEYLQQQVQSGWGFRPPEGESRKKVLNRTLTALAELQNKYPGEMILVVCHEGIIKCLIYHLMVRRFLPEEPKIIYNFHLHLLSMQSGIPKLEKLNHLALAGAEGLK